ncbi:hypothetical protein BD779DRAFT_153607 [Infundibulicybe gibba]|nr:hypothetical protein BD779DRAFT_153607 [Infundibulicybe gibba]
MFAIKDEKTFDIFKAAYADYGTVGGSQTHVERARAPRNEPGPSNAKPQTGVVAIAHSTLEAVERGSFTIDDVSYDIKDAVNHSKSHTKYFEPDLESISCWEGPPAERPHTMLPTTEIFFHPLTTVQGARLLSTMLLVNPSQRAGQLIGVLNFASAKNPGGGFLGGARAQEESIARSSSLYASLTTPTARAFYDLHQGSLRKGYYSHAMIYSPRVLLFRDDEGGWEPPLEVEILTSPAVNAGALRRKSPPSEELEAQIASTMRERMGRILYLFEKQGVRNLVLGSYGTGAFRNKIEAVAGIWAELLVHEGARFRNSFDRVIFAVVDRKEWGTNTLEVFKEMFERQSK